MSSMLSVSDFCHDNGISKAVFYKLTRQGRAPKLTKIGRRTLVSQAAAEEWRQRMERETTGEPI